MMARWYAYVVTWDQKELRMHTAMHTPTHRWKVGMVRSQALPSKVATSKPPCKGNEAVNTNSGS